MADFETFIQYFTNNSAEPMAIKMNLYMLKYVGFSFE
jgi:hypothetical protein